MCKKINIFLLVTTLAFGVSSVKPISENTAKWWGAGVGTVVGLGAGKITSLMITDKTKMWTTSGLVCAGAGGLAGYLLYMNLLTYTPQARYLRAEAIVKKVTTDSLIKSEFETSEEIEQHITFRFGTSWPIALARARFEDAVIALASSLDLLSVAKKEAKKDVTLSSLYKKCKMLKEEIREIVRLIEKRVGMIVRLQDYKFQVQLYEQHKEEERRRMHEMQMHKETLREREKDREFKQVKYGASFLQKERAMSNSDVPVRVNVNI